MQLYTLNTLQPKYGLNLVNVVEDVFSFVHGCSYSAAIVFDQTHIVSSTGNAGW